MTLKYTHQNAPGLQLHYNNGPMLVSNDVKLDVNRSLAAKYASSSQWCWTNGQAAILGWLENKTVEVLLSDCHSVFMIHAAAYPSHVQEEIKIRFFSFHLRHHGAECHKTASPDRKAVKL